MAHRKRLSGALYRELLLQLLLACGSARTSAGSSGGLGPRGGLPEASQLKTQPHGCWLPSETTPHLISLLGPQEMACHVLRQHVGDQGLIPAPHLIDPFLLVVDLNLPQEQCPCQFFHLWTDTGKVCSSRPFDGEMNRTRRGSSGKTGRRTTKWPGKDKAERPTDGKRPPCSSGGLPSCGSAEF